MLGLYWPVIVVALFLIFLLYPFRLHISYDTTKNNTMLVVSLLMFGNALRVPLNISLTDVRKRLEHVISDSDKTSSPADASDTSLSARIDHMIRSLQHVFKQQIRPAVQFTYQTIRRVDACEQFVWRTTLGTGDAAETALLVGTLWSTKHVITSFLADFIRFSVPPALHVEAEWDTPRLQVQFHCIFRFRIGKLTTAWLIQWLRYGWKGARSFG